MTVPALLPRRGALVAVNCTALANVCWKTSSSARSKSLHWNRLAPGQLHPRRPRHPLFLDEIGETTPEFQLRLLRILEKGVVGRWAAGELPPGLHH